MEIKTTILVLGNNWLCWQVVRWLREQDEALVGLVLHPPHKRAYGSEIIDSAGVDSERIFDGSQLEDPRTVEAIRALHPDLGLSVLFDYRLKPEFLALFPKGVMNLHPSYLPYNRGQYPNVWSIVERTPAGVTLHYMDEGLDTGEMMTQVEVPVEPVDTGETLYRKLERAAVSLFQQTWPRIKAGSVQRIPQDTHAGNAHRTQDVGRIDAIDLDRTYRARELIDILRARTFPPYPGAYVTVNGKRVNLRLELSYGNGGTPDTRSSPSARQTTVLISAAGGAGTTEIITSLRATGRYRVVATDASPHATGLSVADRGVVVPLVTHPGFLEVLTRLVRAERPDFIIPLIDEEILPCHRLIEELGPGAPRLVTPRREFCEMALDKWRTFLMLRDAGLSTPQTWLASDAEACTFPAVIKPRDGRGSRGMACLNGRDDLTAYLARARRPASDFVVQEHMAGMEYTVSVIVGLGGPLLAVVPKEVLIKRGITQVGVTRIVPEVEVLCRLIQERMHADGPFNVQLIMGPDRLPSVIEINPRYSTTTALTIAAGLNEVDVVVRQALGEPVGSLTFQPDLLMVRSTAHLYVPEVEWPPRRIARAAAEASDELVGKRT